MKFSQKVKLHIKYRLLFIYVVIFTSVPVVLDVTDKTHQQTTVILCHMLHTHQEHQCTVPLVYMQNNYNVHVVVMITVI